MSTQAQEFASSGDQLPQHANNGYRISVDPAHITVTGHLDATSTLDVILDLYALAPHQTAQDHTELTPIASQPIGASRTFTITVDRSDETHDRYYMSFLVVARTADGSQVVASPQYVTRFDFPARHEYPYPQARSKKGLQVQMVDDAVELGIGHAALNVQFDRMMLLEQVDPENTIVFRSQGRDWYFDRAFVETQDQRIKVLSDNDIIVHLILLVYRNATPNSAMPKLVHPETSSRPNAMTNDEASFEDQLQDGIVLAFDTATAEGIAYFTAAVEFLTERYTRDDQQHGRALGYIVGNEVNSQWIWQNMGEQPLERFMLFHERAVRIVYMAAQKSYRHARIYISLDHLWNRAFRDEPTRYYRGRDVIEEMNRLSKGAGDYPWHVAYHPYPEDLTKPATWNDTTALESFDTPRITFKNLHVLGQFLGQDHLRYGGEIRRVSLSEQGFHTPDLSDEAQKLQAAAYAYAYYKVLFDDGIDTFILHRHVDSKNEFGLRLGLWSWDDTSAENSAPGEKKAIYDVFQRIDTADSASVTAFALPIVGITDWNDAIPNFDPSRIA